MSLADPERAVACLAPLRRALLRAAEADAAATLAAAEAQAAAQLADARAQAELRVAEAAAEARADAERLIARERSATRRQAQFLVLSARRAAYERLRAEARRAAVELRTGAGYEQLQDRLAEHARQVLGPAAAIVLDPPGRAGVVAEAGGRRVDFSLTALADRALDDLAESVELLWQ